MRRTRWLQLVCEKNMHGSSIVSMSTCTSMHCVIFHVGLLMQSNCYMPKVCEASSIECMTVNRQAQTEYDDAAQHREHIYAST